MLEARSIHRYISSSPRKMRLVIDLIRGRSVPDALAILHFQPKHASKVAEKVLRSAIANLHQKDEGSRIDNETLFVKTAYVDCGPGQKRVLPAPMGRAYRIVKRSNHVTIVIAQREQKKKQKPAPAAAAAKPKAKASSATKE